MFQTRWYKIANYYSLFFQYLSVVHSAQYIEITNRISFKVMNGIIAISRFLVSERGSSFLSKYKLTRKFGITTLNSF